MAWRTKVSHFHVGYFDDENEAAKAYDEAAISVARDISSLFLNFPIETYIGKRRFTDYPSKHDIAPRNGTSKYRGVMWDKTCFEWRAKIKLQGKTKYIGLYQDEIDAAKAYDREAIRARGPKTILNFPTPGSGRRKRLNELDSKKFGENMEKFENNVSERGRDKPKGDNSPDNSGRTSAGSEATAPLNSTDADSKDTSFTLPVRLPRPRNGKNRLSLRPSNNVIAGEESLRNNQQNTECKSGNSPSKDCPGYEGASGTSNVHNASAIAQELETLFPPKEIQSRRR